MSDQLHKPGDWMKVFRRIRFDRARDGVKGAAIKAVGTMLASWADYADGTNIRPGTAQVAVACEIDYRTAKKCVAILRELGLIKLVRKADRRGHSDVYRLNIPEDLLDRPEIDVWAPDRYESEINRVRVKNRGRYNPTDLRVTVGTAETGLRDTQRSAETGPADTSAGHTVTRRTESAGNAVPNLRGTPCPPTYQSTYQGSVPSSGDLPEKLEVSRARAEQDPNLLASPTTAVTTPAFLAPPPQRDHPAKAPKPRVTCPHGNTNRRDKGIPRCPHCRAAAPVTTPDPPELAPATCKTHGLQGGNRPDGQPNCTMCRVVRTRGLAETVTAHQEQP